jgi:hypothetical protein
MLGMKTIACCLSWLGMLTLLIGIARGQQQGPVPLVETQQAATAPIDGCGCEEGGLLGWLRLPFFSQCDDAVCRNHGCAHSHLFCPFELYLRTGVSLTVGGNRLNELLDDGVTVEGGVKTFSYESDRSAAWLGTLGVDYIYNNSSDITPIGTRQVAIPNPISPQLPPTILTVPLLIREAHRTSLHIGGGKEWYWGEGTPESWRYAVGVEGGGRLGHLHVKFTSNPALRETDFFQGVFLSTYADVLIPRCGYDILLGGRFEWGHDWVTIAEEDHDLDQLLLLVSAGIRY